MRKHNANLKRSHGKLNPMVWVNPASPTPAYVQGMAVTTEPMGRSDFLPILSRFLRSTDQPAVMHVRGCRKSNSSFPMHRVSQHAASTKPPAVLCGGDVQESGEEQDQGKQQESQHDNHGMPQCPNRRLPVFRIAFLRRSKGCIGVVEFDRGCTRRPRNAVCLAPSMIRAGRESCYRHLSPSGWRSSHCAFRGSKVMMATPDSLQ